ncbi:MAG: tetratricopeptide repeat protein [Bacteroidales bacterium]|nr:tetratricopeptide repeat protein [Bacteroidales bacterium]
MIYKRGYDDNGNINYRIGQCFLNIPGEKSKAIPYLEQAVQLANAKYQEGVFKEKNAPFDAYYYLGNAYRINNQFEKAKASYEQFKTFFKTTDKERLSLADKEIEACNFALIEMSNPIDVKINQIGRPLSTNSSDINPVVSGDLKSMVFISRQKFYDALFYSRKVNGNWSTPINITPEVQSDGDQYPTFMSYDGKELYLRKEDNLKQISL